MLIERLIYNVTVGRLQVHSLHSLHGGLGLECTRKIEMTIS